MQKWCAGGQARARAARPCPGGDVLRADQAGRRQALRRGIAGGAVYDGLVALAAKEHGVALATRDARARGTYDALGVKVILVA
jgi:hypothetical protein